MKPHELLKEIIVQNQSELCYDRPLFKVIIYVTFMNSNYREKNVLNLVLDEGIVDEFINSPDNIEIDAPRFIDNLVHEYGIQKDLAQWAVYAWAYSLGATIDMELLQIDENLSGINKVLKSRRNPLLIVPPHGMKIIGIGLIREIDYAISVDIRKH